MTYSRDLSMLFPMKPEPIPSVEIASSRDTSLQKALFMRPACDGASGPVPLLVALHTWSVSYTRTGTYFRLARERGWACVAPDFRGPNRRPEACASPLAIQDVLDAVAFARAHAEIDPDRIYLAGCSGGGHMALMMAAMAPELWAGVSVWVPISDLAAWHRQTIGHPKGYDKMLEACCGGAPEDPVAAREYHARSPLHVLAKARSVNLDIYTGIHDGHTGSVPVSQSLHAFNVLAAAHGLPGLQIPAGEVAIIDRDEVIPPSLQGLPVEDPGLHMPIHFRRVAESTRITIFEGGHEQDPVAALDWLSRQVKGRPADFSVHAGKEGRAGRKVAVSH